MRRGWKWMLAGLLVFAAGFYAGGFFGAHRLWKIIEPIQRQELALSIDSGVDALLWLRTGEPDKALRRMEQRLDMAILGLTQQRAAEDFSAEERQTLLLAKYYRLRYPFASAMEGAPEALNAIPDEPIAPARLSAAMRSLVAPQPAATGEAQP